MCRTGWTPTCGTLWVEPCVEPYMWTPMCVEAYVWGPLCVEAYEWNPTCGAVCVEPHVRNPVCGPYMCGTKCVEPYRVRVKSHVRNTFVKSYLWNPRLGFFSLDPICALR